MVVKKKKKLKGLIRSFLLATAALLLKKNFFLSTFSFKRWNQFFLTRYVPFNCWFPYFSSFNHWSPPFLKTFLFNLFPLTTVITFVLQNFFSFNRWFNSFYKRFFFFQPLGCISKKNFFQSTNEIKFFSKIFFFQSLGFTLKQIWVSTFFLQPLESHILHLLFLQPPWFNSFY